MMFYCHALSVNQRNASLVNPSHFLLTVVRGLKNKVPSCTAGTGNSCQASLAVITAWDHGNVSALAVKV